VSIKAKIREVLWRCYDIGCNPADEDDVRSLIGDMDASIRAAMVRLVVAQQWALLWEVYEDGFVQFSPRDVFKRAEREPCAVDVVAAFLGESDSLEVTNG